jgi:(p)ppGpp synthase/HD superfamily hydrolase
VYSPLVEKAIACAIRAHAGQERKGQPGVPYVVHPLHVGLLLARHGFEAAVVAAGILHDVLEDGGVTQADLERELGEEVASIVAEVSEDKSRSWEERKQHTIDSIPAMSAGARAVTAADKVHNLADLDRLLLERGHSVWKLFRRGREPTLDYYRRVLERLERHLPHPLTTELAALLERVASC